MPVQSKLPDSESFEYNELYKGISILAEQISSLADVVLPEYKEFTNSVISGRIIDIHEIEHFLDYMLTFCFDKRILLLYKKILRHLYNEHPDTVHLYVEAYYDMYEESKLKKRPD